MKKRFAYTMVGSLILAFSGAVASEYITASSTTTDHEKFAQTRAKRPRKSKAAPAVTPKKVSAGEKPLYGVMHYQFDGSMQGFVGPVQINKYASKHTVLGNFNKPNAFCGVYFDGKYLQSYYNPDNGSNVTYITYDATTWEPLTGEWNYINGINGGAPVADMLPYALTYDHTTGRIFGCFYANAYLWWIGSSDAQFGYFDIENPFEPVTILNRELPERLRAAATDKDGQVWGLAYSGNLYKINKFTGEATATGTTVELYSAEGSTDMPFSSYGRESIAVDWETGDFYLAYGDDMDDSYVGKFNPQTGDFELLADYSYSFNDWEYGDQFTGLFFVQKAEATDDVIPVAVSDLAIMAVGTDLKAAVTFTMPSVDTNDQAIDADFEWFITNGNDQLATGTAHSGANVTTTVDVTVGGSTAIVVYTSLDGHNSASATKQTFIGEDEPVIWGVPEVDAGDMTATIYWEEAYAKNNGNLGDLTYKITRMPDEVVVAEAATGTKFTDKLTSEYKTRYTYVIEPKAGSTTGAAVTSRAAWIGKYLALPYADDFSDESRFLEYPFIDANGDYNIWEHTTRSGGAAMYPANDEAADDYLLIGPFKMDAGVTYAFHMSADGHNMNETIALYVGTDANNVASFSTELVAPTLLEPMKGTKAFDVTYEPAEAGDYYFGIKACTPHGSQYIYVYEVSVKAIGGTAPAAPTAFEAVPGATTATLNFNLPETAVDGSKVEGLTEARIYRDGELIGTLTEGIAAGAAVSYVDEDAVSRGYHSYSVTAVNAEGEGKSATQQLWRGADMPGRPSNLRFWEDLDTPGLIHATFEHPKRGYYGGYVNPAEIYYLVDYLTMNGNAGVIELGYGTEHTFQLPGDVTTQTAFAGSIYGRNSSGSVASSGNWLTQTCTIGNPDVLPIQETWPDQSGKTAWTGQTTDEDEELFGAFWNISYGDLTSIQPQDNDHGMMALGTTHNGGGKRILSPRFTVEGTTNPSIVFYYHYTPDVLDFNLEVIVEDQPIRVLEELNLDAANSGKWIRKEVSLSEFKGTKYIQLAFHGHGNAAEEFVAFDNVTISDLRRNDLKVMSFTAPVKVAANDEAELALTVRNAGGNDVNAGDYTV
ncbi:MAG: hypothetical protein K2M55_03790, partial [Muribaculaceae bacterium]|nr:hypothetical protein [Muribaculaceae bacterium]